MLKKIIVSFAIGTALFLVCLQLANSYFTVEAEEGFYKKVSWLRSNVLGGQVNKIPVLMINTGTDVQEFKHPPRSAVVADRSDLIKLFQLIIQSKNTTTAVMLNLDMTDDRNFLPKVKDSLQTLISQLPFVCIPEIRKGEEIKNHLSQMLGMVGMITKHSARIWTR